MASNELCEDYKIVLKKKQSRFNFWSGFASTVTGAAGAIAPAASTAKYFSALSGVSAGTRAEYNQNYFADVAAQVVTKGINKRRSDILERINDARTRDTSEYTVELAIADAINYHGACSLIGGIETADAATSKIDVNLGLDTLGANAFFLKATSGSSSSSSSSSSNSSSSTNQ